MKEVIRESNNQWGLLSCAVFKHWDMNSVKDIVDFSKKLPECSNYDFSDIKKIEKITLEDIFSF
ncbi:hypothetical protein JXA84_00705 [candidate division WOR-3 bacterium]|nr:hypothetical protein [candidate division WOR-3 bacterium]